MTSMSVEQYRREILKQLDKPKAAKRNKFNVQPIQYDHMKQMRVAFESWLKGQALFSTLVYQYGSDVLIYDDIDGYKVLAVALAFEVWKKLDECKQANQGLALLGQITSSTQMRGGDHGQ